MKIRHLVSILLLTGCCVVSAQTNAGTNAPAHAKTTRPAIYDESADGSKSG